MQYYQKLQRYTIIRTHSFRATFITDLFKLVPIDNVKDLKEIPENIKNTLEIIPVSNIEEVLKHALV